MTSVEGATKSQYEVAELRKVDENRWDRFVEAHSDGTFFHLSGWRKIIEEALNHPTIFLCCKKEERITGILPLAQVKSWMFGNALVSLPFLVYGGAVAENSEVERLLVDAACAKANELQVDHLELRNKEFSERSWPTKEIYATFRKEIDVDPEQNLMAIPRKQRAMIRKGIKAGLTAEIDQNAARLYPALLACKRNLGTPFFNQRYLQFILDTFEDSVEILTVTKGAETVCSVMSFKFRNEILPYYGGGGELARSLYGNDFMYWSVMEKAGLEGTEIFDYGRSMIGSGAYRFKKHWGFTPVSLAYEFYLVKEDKMPNVNPANPKFRFLIDTWKRLPLPVAGRLGPPIARRLG